MTDTQGNPASTANLPAPNGDAPSPTQPRAIETEKTPSPLPRFEFIAALIMGVLLLIVAVPAVSYSWMPVAFSSAILAAGISLVLYAFGSFVQISLKWLVATGCAAVMFATYYFINQQHAKEFVEIMVVSPGPKFSIPKAKIDGRLLVGGLVSPDYDATTQRTESDSFRIILRAGQDLTSTNQWIELSLLFRGREEPTTFRNISTDHLYGTLGKVEAVRWTISREMTKLYLVRRERGEFKQTLISDFDDPTQTRTHLMLPGLVSKAWAQVMAPCDDKVSTFEASFKSEDPETRRASRAAAAKLGPCIVKPLMVMYDNNRNNYRVMLGVAVALSAMLSDNKDQRIFVDGSLTQDNINELVKLSIHQDSTLRSYAVEFLFDLASPKTIRPMLQAGERIETSGFADKNAAYNLVLIASNVIKFTDAAGRQELSTFFRRWRTKVNPKADAMIAKM